MRGRKDITARLYGGQGGVETARSGYVGVCWEHVHIGVSLSSNKLVNGVGIWRRLGLASETKTLLCRTH